ncbi:histidine kinase [Streptomyces sp. DH12]|uniref:sensor histidine kinase n=1 Tax=Streptomyces sp. DH12 TaxID=2857010 RepID=UPI001E2FD924|nr:histidine kinase [Streptomyces sp. DH12]
MTTRATAERVLVVAAVAELLTVADAFSAVPLAVCTVALLALPLRRRLPMATLCATLPSILTGHLWLPAMLAMFTVACDRPRPRVAAGCGLLFAAAACPWPPGEFAAMTREEVLTTVEAAALLSVGPAALGLLAATRAELRARLVDLTATQRRERELESERAVVRERARLAREMHDTVAHHVGIIAVQSGALRAAEGAAGDAWKRDTAESIRRHSVRALEELRDMVGVLRTSDTAAASAAGRTGLDTLRDLAADSLLDVTADVTAPEAGRLRPEVESAAFRIVQESLNNVRKHAPGARVTVVVAPAPDGRSLAVEVRNAPPPPSAATGPAASPAQGGAQVAAPGESGDPEPVPGGPGEREPLPEGAGEAVAELPGGGYGLAGLRERAELLGGCLSAHPCPAGGFTVRAVLPL